MKQTPQMQFLNQLKAIYNSIKGHHYSPLNDNTATSQWSGTWKTNINLAICLLLSHLLYSFYSVPYYIRLTMTIGKMTWYLIEYNYDFSQMQSWIPFTTSTSSTNTIRDTSIKSINWIQWLWSPLVESKRLLHLDTFRGIAAYIVFIHHTIQDVGHNRQIVTKDYKDSFRKTSQLRFYMSEGNLMVPLFLVLSGFILCKIHWTFTRSKNLKKLIVGRMTRFYPAHFLAEFLYLVFSSYASYHWRQSEFKLFSSEGLAQCLSLTQTWRIAGWPSNKICNYPSWTLSTELMFNIGMYIIIRYLPVYWSLFMFEIATIFSYFAFTEFYNHSKILQILFAFCIGILYYKLFGQLKAYRPIIQFAFDIICVYLIVSINSFFYRDIHFNPSKTYNWEFHSPLWGLYMIIAIDNSFIIKKCLSYFHVIGDISFALYLIHVPLNDFYLILVNYGYMPLLDSDFKLAIWGAIVGVIAYMMHKEFEMPAKRYLDDYLGISYRKKVVAMHEV